MALTQVNINSLSKGGRESMVQSTIEFNCECVINEPELTTYYSAYFIESGNAEVTVDFNQYKIEPNTFIFTRPGQVFSVQSEDKLMGVRLAFDEQFYCPRTENKEIGCKGILYDDLIGSPVLTISKSQIETVKELINRIEESFSESQITRTELLRSYLKIFIIKCTDIKRNQIDDAIQGSELESDFVRRFNVLVETKFRDWHSVSNYADHFLMTPKSLSKKLAKYNVTPSKVIYDRLMMESKRLLIYSSLSIKEISYELNFDDPSHFSTFFKRHEGMSPLVFKKSILGEVAG
jgi:AraC-like DNA-binding protein